MPTKATTKKKSSALAALTSTAPAATRRGPGRPARAETAEKLAVWLPADLLLAFKLDCTRHRLTMSEVAAGLIREYMAGRE